MMENYGTVVVDLVELAAESLAEIDISRPTDDHIVRDYRIKLATHLLADQGPGAYFNQIMEAVEIAAGPCQCERCRAEPAL